MAEYHQTLDTTEGQVARSPDSRRDAGPAWLAAGAAGFDMSLIEENLRMTPLTRARQHHRAINLALQLRDAVKRKHGGL